MRTALNFVAVLMALITMNAIAAFASDQVEVVLFSDFQCPFCAQLAQPIRQLQLEGVEGIRTSIHFKNFPLAMHADAALAHHVAMAAGKQGKFWEMHDFLFAHQAALKRENLVNYAKTLQLDVDRFRADMESTDVNELIEADITEGTKRGINATPTFYINGKQFTGTRTFEQLKKIIQDAHSRAEALAEITDDLL